MANFSDPHLDVKIKVEMPAEDGHVPLMTTVEYSINLFGIHLPNDCDGAVECLVNLGRPEM